MAATPQQILAKNKGLIIVYALAIVPIPLWFVLVGGGVKGGKPGTGPQPPSEKWSPTSFDVAKRALDSIKKDVEALSKKIKSGEPVYTAKHIEIFKKRNEDRQAQVDKMAEVFRERDKVIEKWFDKFQDTPAGKEPSHGDFSVAFTTAVEDLGRENAKLVTFDAATKKSFLFGDAPPQAPGQLRIWQKRYWLQNEVVQGLKNVPDAKLGGQIVFGAAPAGGGSSGGQPAAKKPYDLLPVSFTVVCSFRDVPKLTRELLSRQIVFRIQRLDIELMDFQYDRSRDFAQGPQMLKINESGAKKYFDNYGYTVHFHDGKDAPQPNDSAAEEKLIPEPPVRVEVALEAFDFDMDVIAPAPAAPEKK